MADFCRSEGVSQPSFYQWRKKLKAVEAGSSPSVARSQFPTNASSGNASGRRFQPLQITPAPDRHRVLTIRLPDGIEIEVGHDPAVIESVIRQLLESNPSTEARQC